MCLRMSEGSRTPSLVRNSSPRSKLAPRMHEKRPKEHDIWVGAQAKRVCLCVCVRREVCVVFHIGGRWGDEVHVLRGKLGRVGKSGGGWICAEIAMVVGRGIGQRGRKSREIRKEPREREERKSCDSGMRCVAAGERLGPSCVVCEVIGVEKKRSNGREGRWSLCCPCRARREEETGASLTRWCATPGIDAALSTKPLACRPSEPSAE